MAKGKPSTEPLKSPTQKGSVRRPASTSTAAPAANVSIEPAPPSLKEVQDAFQRAVVDGDDAVMALIPPNSRTGVDVLIGVYRHAYRGRLVEILANDYELLTAYLGPDAFREAALGYIETHPSRTPNARWFSHALPEFLATAPETSGRIELAELAALERALADAFDASDDPVATLDALRTVPPERWGELVFAPHSAARRLDHTTNSFDLWRLLKDGEAPPDIARHDDPERLLVWREGATSRVRVLGAEEAMLWDEAAKGVPFAALCELSAIYDDPATAALRAAQVLQGWLTTGALAKAEVPA
ncbi:MAG: HvfC/BufC family peptide modification chaperone [Hyphomicrobium sp.]